jgi:DNA polymerase-3 subunit gamma/tau
MIGEQDAQAMGMDDMPPPWDEEMFFDAAPARSAVNVKPVKLDVPSVTSSAVETSVMVATENVAVETLKAKPEPVSAILADRQVSSSPVPELNWDGLWPNLAASLPLRGVSQQLAQQSELVSCKQDGNAHVFRLRVPLPTLLSAGSVDKLTAALTERFEKNIRVETEIGAVEQTANAQAVAERGVRQQQAEASIQGDSFVQTLMREFGATIVTGSVRPI